MKSPLQLTGIGLRTPHDKEMSEKHPGVAWLEVHSEEYFVEGGIHLTRLEKLRSDYPISLHGSGLSLGSADELNWQYLKKLKELASNISPCLISDHLAWTSLYGHYLHDLLPLPYTEEALDHLVPRIQQVQAYLGRQILIENIANYFSFNESCMTEEVFLKETAQQSGCGILLDVTNIYVSASHLNFDPFAYIAAIPPHLVQEIHLAGFNTTMVNQQESLIDSHDRAIVPAVWDLYRHAIKHVGTKPTMIEWDNDLPALDTLCLEAFRAEKIMRECHVAAKLTG